MALTQNRIKQFDPWTTCRKLREIVITKQATQYKGQPNKPV
jgi:hypothetical protein